MTHEPETPEGWRFKWAMDPPSVVEWMRDAAEAARVAVGAEPRLAPRRRCKAAARGANPKAGA